MATHGLEGFHSLTPNGFARALPEPSRALPCTRTVGECRHASAGANALEPIITAITFNKYNKNKIKKECKAATFSENITQHESAIIHCQVGMKSVRLYVAAMVHMSPSSRGLGHCPLTAVTGVRIPLGAPKFLESLRLHTCPILCIK